MTKNLTEEKERGKREETKLLEAHFLLRYLYTGDGELLEKAWEYADKELWESFRCGVLLETKEDFFDYGVENLPDTLKDELRRKFYYLNLNDRQSLLLFSDVHCDYRLVIKQIYTILRRRYTRATFYLAVSKRFEGYQDLPEILRQLEIQMEERFYRGEDHIYFSEEDELNSVSKEMLDSQLVQKIAKDVSRKDTEHLCRHFEMFKEKYMNNSTFSAMYIKFVFSNVIQELFQERQFSAQGNLAKEIDRLYGCNRIKEIIQVTEDNVKAYVKFIDQTRNESQKEAALARMYICQHCEEALIQETVAEKVKLPVGYFSFVFGHETGLSIPAYVHSCRMERAKKLLKEKIHSIEEICKNTGFHYAEYFTRSYWRYYGYAPETE